MQDDMAQGVGARLRALRESTGVSLRGLAKALGISPSAVSQIERGHLQPSLGRVIAMTEALGVPLTSAFAPGRLPPGAIVRAEGVVVARSGDNRAVPVRGGVTIRRLTPRPVDGVEFFESVYPPGSASNAGAPVQHEGLELGTVTSGELTVELGSETLTLCAGDSISFPSTTPHLLSNRSSVNAVATWIILHPPGGVPRTPQGDDDPSLVSPHE
ncbi:helix-turn-helix domain-containing protein [Sinomonas sp. JGH33]|uniref:Helix-turn-helix domain-containing protein n=1 Tax=Sinomonas terricola TaxID=3110330 RepID=A0ABU5T5A6_9MICC|nr:helix-turn-helix domain-containing protein [Sinomonas sp. JGH33]MEA5454848.1 helix-turn-helix domain-containing protein [Sinomonas sp. JGH33]